MIPVAKMNFIPAAVELPNIPAGLPYVLVHQHLPSASFFFTVHALTHRPAGQKGQDVESQQTMPRSNAEVLKLQQCPANAMACGGLRCSSSGPAAAAQPR